MLCEGFFGEKQVRKTVDDIRKAIGIVKYGLDEYLKAIEEVPDFDINALDVLLIIRHKCYPYNKCRAR